MRLILSLFLGLLTTHAQGGELYYENFCILCVDELSMEFTEIKNKRDPYFPKHEVEGSWRHGLALNWDVRAFEKIYWTNRAYFDTDHAVRHIGWKYELGINPFKNLDVFWQHHSQHIAEGVAPGEKPDSFPLDDRFGIRVYFINNRTNK